MVSPQRKIIFDKKLYDRLVSLCVDALPEKAYGIIAGNGGKSDENGLTDQVELGSQGGMKDQNGYKVEEIYPLQTNLRPDNEKINGIFQSYGEFYCDKDRGFWIDKREQFEVLKRIADKGQKVVAIYHSHRCRLATPSQVDIDLHYDSNALALIVSVVNPQQPEVKAFEISNDQFWEAEIVIHFSEKDPIRK
jgi:proteasome lid subunit RPN8/RPN11